MPKIENDVEEAPAFGRTLMVDDQVDLVVRCHNTGDKLVLAIRITEIVKDKMICFDRGSGAIYKFDEQIKEA